MLTFPPAYSWGPGPPENDYQFVWVINGGFRWRHSGSEYALDPRSVLLIRPGMRDIYVSHVQRSTRYGYVHFRPTRPLTHSAQPAEESWPTLRALQDWDPIRSLLQYVIRLRDDDPEEHSMASHTLGLALRLFLRGHHLEPRGELPPILQAVIWHVYNMWADGHLNSIPVDELVDAAGVSRGHLSRLFRTWFGIGPSAALELVRLCHAATLLTRSGLTLDEVAHTCGFADSHHLSHRFRPRYGVPPGRYRTNPTAPSPMAPLYEAGLEQLAEQLL